MIHLTENYYLTADSLNFILFQKVIYKKGKNIGQEYNANMKYFPTLGLLYKFLFNQLNQDWLSDDKINDWEEMKAQYVNLIILIKKLNKKYKPTRGDLIEKN